MTASYILYSTQFTFYIHDLHHGNGTMYVYHRDLPKIGYSDFISRITQCIAYHNITR